jgi:catechol 2,3-dioxygenase-like lactoylglutathione lyase family enzyme
VTGITGAQLDHVAIAVERRADAWPRFLQDLGGRWHSHGPGIGFSFCQLEYANRMRVEILKPHGVENNDFLRRFLDRNGPGPHHLTFKVPDIEAAIAAAGASGSPPVAVNLTDPEWKEAFLHPKTALGTVVQLAQEAESPTGDWRTAPPAELPPSTRPAASLLHVAHAVSSLADGVHLFEHLLGGVRAGGGSDGRTRWVDLAWTGPGRIRLLEPVTGTSPVGVWLQGRRGGVHHLAFSCPDPASIEAAVPRADGSFEVAPEHAQGTRLRLLPTS